MRHSLPRTGHIRFHSCIFNKTASFKNRVFGDSTSFRRSVFKVAPFFHNSELHQGTEFLKEQFTDIKTDEAEKAYSTLKLAMNKHHAHAEEMMFFGLEMQARRYKTKWPSKALYLIYEACSDYGQSIARPAVMLLGTFCFFLIWYWMILFNGRLDEVVTPTGAERIGKLYVFTLEHTAPFLLPVLKTADRFPTLDGSDPSAWTSTLIAGHTTIAIVLFFFLLLGIRNRFRLKG
ncbi:hypothetical protein [Ferrovibrio xuzhouensis]|uniref:Uncharacterized protein n=1 Tax=Ferrovibrio xuzhouensis TaxID=1576914 RepID=A0ABV7VG73_9PROT